MKSVKKRFLFLIVAALLFSSMVIASQASARVVKIKPNRIEIIRMPGLHSHISHETVAKAQLIQDLYTYMLSLPVAPSDEICPSYIIANYQLTFYYNKTVVKKVYALKGRCQPVTFSSNDIRTADNKFWGLMSKVVAAGVAIPASTQTRGTVSSGPSTGGMKNIGSPTPTPTAVLSLTPTSSTPTLTPVSGGE